MWTKSHLRWIDISMIKTQYILRRPCSTFTQFRFHYQQEWRWNCEKGVVPVMGMKMKSWKMIFPMIIMKMKSWKKYPHLYWDEDDSVHYFRKMDSNFANNLLQTQRLKFTLSSHRPRMKKIKYVFYKWDIQKETMKSQMKQ